MACKESKTDKKQKQIGEENPFMFEMDEEAWQACAFDEAGAQQLLEDDDGETSESGC
jgi:hypothetical protein